jgi:hypothetical protein
MEEEEEEKEKQRKILLSSLTLQRCSESLLNVLLCLLLDTVLPAIGTRCCCRFFNRNAVSYRSRNARWLNSKDFPEYGNGIVFKLLILSQIVWHAAAAKLGKR